MISERRSIRPFDDEIIMMHLVITADMYHLHCMLHNSELEDANMQRTILSYK